MRMLGQKDENMPVKGVQVSCEAVKEKAELLRLLWFDPDGQGFVGFINDFF